MDRCGTDHGVDEKYYLSQKLIDCFNAHKEGNRNKGNGFGWDITMPSDTAKAVMTKEGSRPESTFITTEKDNCLVVPSPNNIGCEKAHSERVLETTGLP